MCDDTLAELKLTKPASDDAILNDSPTDDDFDECVSQKEREIYKAKFHDLSSIKQYKLHCTSCDKHLGCAPKNANRMRRHPMLLTLVCVQCQEFYDSGEFEKGDDGSELYCRWCGQGGQVFCCSDCPHVFCAKCIKRNLGGAMVKLIESVDDWKCFKCNPTLLYELRAICWALLRYCSILNRLAKDSDQSELKEMYSKECALDHSTCCKEKMKRKSLPNKSPNNKKKEEEPAKKSNESILSKIPSTIQVKKFATMTDSNEKKRKRPSSPVLMLPPKNIGCYKNPITIANYSTIMRPPLIQPAAKKPRMPNVVFPNAFKVPERRPAPSSLTKLPNLRPKPPITIGLQNMTFNSTVIPNDTINLSLESLTQGLDFATVAAISNNSNNNDDVVCTPDFPMEPLCEVTEESVDDDVECITPGPIVPPKKPVYKTNSTNNKSGLLPDISPDNIVQMTDNDVTVNSATGGLKFRVDPQTLSSNKMYRLPDGRIFAINANSKMPGGYSATIVAVSDQSGSYKTAAGKTFAAKLSAVSTQSPQPPPPTRVNVSTKSDATKAARKGSKPGKYMNINLNIPVEWFRYNLIDAIDSLDYSLTRLKKLKAEATTMFLRSRSEDEIRNLHRSLDRLLSTSTTRFGEVRKNLNQGFKDYLKKKSSNEEVSNEDDDDDDDVQILTNEVEDPIYIDENSVDSHNNDEDSDQSNSTEKEKTLSKLQDDVSVKKITKPSEGENSNRREKDGNGASSKKEKNRDDPVNDNKIDDTTESDTNNTKNTDSEKVNSEACITNGDSNDINNDEMEHTSNNTKESEMRNKNLESLLKDSSEKSDMGCLESIQDNTFILST